MDQSIEGMDATAEVKAKALEEFLIKTGDILTQGVMDSCFLRAYSAVTSSLQRAQRYSQAEDLLTYACQLATELVRSEVAHKRSLKKEGLRYIIRAYQVCPVRSFLNAKLNLEAMRRQGAAAYEATDYLDAYEFYAFVYGCDPSKLPRGEVLLASIKSDAREDLAEEAAKIQQRDANVQCAGYFHLAQGYYLLSGDAETINQYLMMARKLLPVADDQEQLAQRIGLLEAQLQLLYPDDFHFPHVLKPKTFDSQQLEAVANASQHDFAQQSEEALIAVGQLNVAEAKETAYLKSYLSGSAELRIRRYELASNALARYKGGIVDELFSLGDAGSYNVANVSEALANLMEAYRLCPVLSEVPGYIDCQLFLDQAEVEFTKRGLSSRAIAFYNFVAAIDPVLSEECARKSASLYTFMEAQLAKLLQQATNEQVDDESRAMFHLSAAECYALLDGNSRNLVSSVNWALYLAQRSPERDRLLPIINRFWMRIQALEPEKYDSEYRSVEASAPLLEELEQDQTYPENSLQAQLARAHEEKAQRKKAIPYMSYAEVMEREMIESGSINPETAINTPYLRFYQQLTPNQRLRNNNLSTLILERANTLFWQTFDEDPRECPQVCEAIVLLIHAIQLSPAICNITQMAQFDQLEVCAKLAMETGDFVTAYELYDFANLFRPESLVDGCPDLRSLRSRVAKALNAKLETVGALPQSQRAKAYFDLAYGYFVLGFKEFKIMPPLQNLWVINGSGSFPSW